MSSVGALQEEHDWGRGTSAGAGHWWLHMEQVAPRDFAGSSAWEGQACSWPSLVRYWWGEEGDGAGRAVQLWNGNARRCNDGGFQADQQGSLCLAVVSAALAEDCWRPGVPAEIPDGPSLFFCTLLQFPCVKWESHRIGKL